MRKDPRQRMMAMAEAIRDSGEKGLQEGLLAWRFKISPSTLRTDYRTVLLAVFRDLSFHSGVYRSNPRLEAEIVLNAVRGGTRSFDVREPQQRLAIESSDSETPRPARAKAEAT